MVLHIGRLGALQVLPSPLEGVPIERPRSGGTHTTLGGNAVVDYLGSGGSYEFRWTWLSGLDVEKLEALRSRHIPGPLRFVMPGYRKNRLSFSAASVGLGATNLRNVDITGGDVTSSLLWPSQADPPGRGLEWNNTQAGHAIRLDRDRPAPVRDGDGEAVTGSIWIRSTHADDVLLGLNRWGDVGGGEGGYLGSPVTGSTVTLTADTWTQLTVTAPKDPTTWGVSPAVQIMAKADPASVLTLAAAQVEPGTSATTWRLGGAAPRVAVDSKPLNAPRRTYTHHTLTLLEV